MHYGRYIISFLVWGSLLYLLIGCSSQPKMRSPIFCPVLENPQMTKDNCKELLKDICHEGFILAPLYEPDFYWARCLEDK